MSNEINSHVVYKEASATSFSLTNFKWREVKLKAAPCPSQRPSDRVQRPKQRAGGFTYKESSTLSSQTRNRCILWHYLEGRLKLLEISLDVDLAYNAVELVLECPDLLPDVSIHELGIYDVLVLFGTSTTVYRLVLPHPVRVKRTPALWKDAGEGRVPSVLNFVSESSFVGPNSAALFNQVNSVPTVTCCAACANIDRVATFALASPSGPIVVIQLQEEGLPVRTTLQETSVMGKWLSSFLPVMGKKNVGGASDNAPVSLLAHEFDEQPVVLALCADYVLRVWSVQLSQCVMSHDLSDYLLNRDEGDTSNLEVDQLSLRAACDSTPSIFRFAAHLRNGSFSQISIFEVELMNNQLHMLMLHSCSCPQGSVLVDFTVSRSELWGLWRCRLPDTETAGLSIKQVIYADVSRPTGWREVNVASLPDSQLLILPHLESREFYLEAIFAPGRFSTHAICKALELYEEAECSSEGFAASLDSLREEVIVRVEQEIRLCVGLQQVEPDQYREMLIKSWSKFYRCCLEYQELASQPLALVQDPRTGMGVVLKQSLLSFLRPAHVVECIGSSVPLQGDSSEVVGEIRKFIACVQHVVGKLSPEVLESFILDLGCYGSADINPPIVLAGEMARDLQAEDGDKGLYKQLSSLKDISVVIDTLLAALNPSPAPVEEVAVAEDEDMEEEVDGFVESDLLKTLKGLFGGSIAMAILSSSLLEVCRYRLCLCRDVLVSLVMLRRRAGKELMSYVANTNYQTEFSRLVQRYYSLYWLASHTYYSPVHHTPSSSQFLDLQQLADLDISSSHPSNSSQSPPTSSDSPRAVVAPRWPLPLALLKVRGCEEVVSGLVKTPALFENGSPSLWASCFLPVLDNLLKSLWPVQKAPEVARFLLDNSQHCHLQMYVEMVVGSHNLSSDYTLYYLLGQSLVRTRELQKAFACFCRASNGIMSRSNPMLQSLVEYEEAEGEVLTREEKKEQKEKFLSRYYEKVMRLFEEVSAPQYVILVAQEATRILRSNDERSTVFWAIQFKYQLELGSGKEAYDAMMAIPDRTLRVNCLRQLVIVLTEQNRIQELCDFKYNGLEREVETVMEQRARSVDVVKHQYYSLLYCYHITRNNRRKAAYVMFEHAQRLEREAKGPGVLQKLADCYSMTILLLSLVEPEYAWVLRPVQEPPSNQPHSKRKRPRSGEKKEVQKVEVLTVKDLDKIYSVVKAKLKLLQVVKEDRSMELQLSNSFVTVEEVVGLMVQAGMFDDAVQLARKFSVPLASIFEALAARCVQLSMNFVALTDLSTVDQPDWEWLELNKTLDTVKVKENSIADKAWYLLEASMNQLAGADCALVQRGVAKKLLSMGHALPQWLLDKYKRTNAAELLYLYLSFDHLEQAAHLAVEFIDGVMGHGKEYFGLETALHAASPSVWLPYHLLSHLRLALENAPKQTNFEKLSQNLREKMDQYLQQAAAVSTNIEEYCKYGGL